MIYPTYTPKALHNGGDVVPFRDCVGRWNVVRVICETPSRYERVVGAVTQGALGFIIAIAMRCCYDRQILPYGIPDEVQE